MLLYALLHSLKICKVLVYSKISVYGYMYSVYKYTVSV